MKRIALALLCAALALYAIATALEARHAAFGWVAAFAEAAMVGAVADWFAVVALFRHPLGLRIPHTAIIPRNQERIGANLARFICDHFLSDQQVLERLRSIGPAARLADWLRDPSHATQVGTHLTKAARYGLSALDDPRVRDFIRASVLERLEQVDVAPLAGRLLDALTENRRHQELLDDVLAQVAALLQDEGVQARIATILAAEARLLRYVGLDQLAADFAAGRIAAAVSRTVGEMGEDPSHPLRLRFDATLARFVERLQHDPAFATKGESIRDELLAHPALGAYLHGVWGDVLAWLRDDLGRDDSSIGRRIAAIALTLGETLHADVAMREWIDGQIIDAAPRWIDRYREQIRGFIEDRVRRWNTEELTGELERNIGPDLQFVRINGTLVGGLVGLVIHALTLALR